MVGCGVVVQTASGNKAPEVSAFCAQIIVARAHFWSLAMAWFVSMRGIVITLTIADPTAARVSLSRAGIRVSLSRAGIQNEPKLFRVKLFGKSWIVQNQFEEF